MTRQKNRFEIRRVPRVNAPAAAVAVAFCNHDAAALMQILAIVPH
jgi:hypothetical protein